MMRTLAIGALSLLLAGDALALRTLKDLDQLAKEFAQPASEAAPLQESVRFVTLDQQTLGPLLEDAAQVALEGEDLGVACEGLVRIPEGFEGALEVISFTPNEDKTRFQAVLGFEGGEVTLKGRLTPLTQVPVLVRRVAPGEAITMEDLEWKKVPSRKVLRTTLTRTEDLIGCMPRSSSIKVGMPLRKGDLERPLMVRRGEAIVMRAGSGRLSIDMQGTAFENGEQGQRIRVLNPVSKRTLYAIVVGPHQVEVEKTLRFAQNEEGIVR